VKFLFLARTFGLKYFQNLIGLFGQQSAKAISVEFSRDVLGQYFYI